MRNQKIAGFSFFCACLVVFIHLPLGEPAAGSILCWFREFFVRGFCQIAVPFFFVVSGFFLGKKAHEIGWWKTAVKKRFSSLVLPYMLWCLIYFLFVHSMILCANFVAHRALSANMFAGGYIGTLKSFWGLDLSELPALIPLWYIRALVLFVILSPVCVWLLKRYARILILFTFAVGVVLDFVFAIDSPMGRFFHFGFPVWGLLYFEVGLLLAVVDKVLVNRMIAAFSFIAALALLAAGVAFDSNQFGHVLCKHALRPCLLLSLWYFWPFGNVRGDAFALFILHPIIITILKFFVPQILSAWMVPIYSLVVILCSLAVSSMMRKCMPKLSLILFGGRS